MRNSRRIRVHRTITTRLEERVLLMGSGVLAFLLTSYLFTHVSGTAAVVYAAVWVCVLLILWSAYKFLLPTSFVMNDRGIDTARK